MSGFLVVLLIVALVATLGALFAGLLVMARGGPANKKYSNVLMRWRVVLQGAAVLILVIALIAASS